MTRPATPTIEDRVPAWAFLALVALATCVAYLPALSGQKLWDDQVHIPKPPMRSLDGLWRIWTEVGATQQYYPLLFTSFWIQHRLWGDQMLDYHLVTLLEHIAAAGLLYAVLRKLAVPGALLATALFALHPVHVESVAWVTEQKNTQSAVFYLAAMLAYLQFDTTRRGSLYGAALALFALALLSKTTTVTLPPVLLVIFWWQRGRLSWRRDVLPLAPFFLLAAVDGGLTTWFERKVAGAEGGGFDLTIVERLILSGRVAWFYVAKLLWPVNLMFVYPRWNIDAGQWWQWLFPAVVAVVLVALWAIRARWRAPLAGALIFLGTLFPVLGFLNIYYFRYSFVTDHFQYLASLGVLVPAAAGMALAFERLSPAGRRVGGMLCVVLVGLLAMLTWRQSRLYGDDAVALYKATLQRNPASWMIHNNLGNALREMGNPQEAIDHFLETLWLKPDHAEAHMNLGITLGRLGQPQQAIDHFRRALELKPGDPEVHFNLGNVLLGLGHAQNAIDQYQAALELKPDYADAHCNMGGALLVLGRPQEATQQCQEALKIDPNSVDAHQYLGSALLTLGRPEDAIVQFERALELKPDDVEACNNLGIALISAGRPTEAVQRFEQATRIKPDYARAWYNLAMAYTQLQRGADARAAGERALELARAQGRTALVQQIETWLNSNRGGPSNVPSEPPAQHNTRSTP